MHREKKRGPASELEEARTERFLGDLNFDRRRSFLGREMRDDEDKYECLESFEEEGREEEANGAASIAAVQNQNLSSVTTGGRLVAQKQLAKYRRETSLKRRRFSC